MRGPYLDAGAQIVQTNTFGGSPAMLAHYGLAERCEEICAAAVTAVRNAVGDAAYVSGSCGPSGEMLRPYGTVDPDELFEGFKRQIGTLVEAGVDVVCVETMTDLNEAQLAIHAAKERSPTTPVMASMTFDQTKRGYFTMMGVNVEAAATGLRAAGADVVGSNCGNGIERMVEIAREFRQHSALPLIIQSNAGLPELVDGKPAYCENARDDGFKGAEADRSGRVDCRRLLRNYAGAHPCNLRGNGRGALSEAWGMEPQDGLPASGDNAHAESAPASHMSKPHVITRRSVASWVLYDLANTIFSMNILSLYFSLYIVEVVGQGTAGCGVCTHYGRFVCHYLLPVAGTRSHDGPGAAADSVSDRGHAGLCAGDGVSRVLQPRDFADPVYRREHCLPGGPAIL